MHIGNGKSYILFCHVFHKKQKLFLYISYHMFNQDSLNEQRLEVNFILIILILSNISNKNVKW